MSNVKNKNTIIHFLKPEEGGRKSLPDSTIYYATTVIEGISPRHWSIVIRFERPLETSEYTASCKVAFLVDDATNNMLDEVSEMPIYEGPKKVGSIVFDRPQK